MFYFILIIHSIEKKDKCRSKQKETTGKNVSNVNKNGDYYSLLIYYYTFKRKCNFTKKETVAAKDSST